MPVSPADFDDDIQAALDTGNTVILDAQEYETTTTLTIPDGGALVGAGSTSSIIVANHKLPAIQMGDNTRVADLGIRSDDFPSASLANNDGWQEHARSIQAGNHCIVENVKIQDASAGVECIGVTDVRVTNLTANDIRERHGWGAVLHSKHSASNIVGNQIYGTDCDRFIETEDASHDCTFTTGIGTRIYPVGYTGQPSDYATYSFVLDAHAHEDEGGTRNVSYDGFLLDGCLQSLSCQRSNGANISDCPVNTSFRNIEIRSPRLGRSVAELQHARGLKLERVTITGSSVYTDSEMIKVFGSDTKDVSLSVTFSSGTYGKRCINSTAPDVKIDRCYFGDRGTQTAIEVVKLGTGADENSVTRSTFDNIGYSTADVSVDASASRCRIEANHVRTQAAHPPTVHFKVTGNDCTVANNTMRGSTVTLPVQVAGARTTVEGNHFLYDSATTLVSLTSASSASTVTGNDSTSGAYTDAGTGNTVGSNRTVKSAMSIATAAAIRDRIYDVIEGTTPTPVLNAPFRRYRNEGAADFDEWAEANVPGCFRRFQIREVGDDEPPDVSNMTEERVRVTFEIRIAYPQNQRYGRDAAMDRDDVINEDWRAINYSVAGIYARSSFSGSYDCTPLGAVKTRETGEGVDFMVIEAVFEYVRATGA